VQNFACPRCGQRLTFENSICLNCGGTLAFEPTPRRFVLIGEHGEIDQQNLSRPCSNRVRAACNWTATDNHLPLCRSCALTRTRPADDDEVAIPEFRRAEVAKRRLVFELLELGLPLIGKDADPIRGVGFDLRSSSREPVVTGHDAGVITLDLAEGDDVHREQLRVSMAEPYRTLLGHFRHEIGHYYFPLLIDGDRSRAEFIALFGDPELDYQSTLDRHYSNGPPADWPERYLSAYATMHPAEDWAETFAHYLHIRDTIDTAAAFGFAPTGETFAAGNDDIDAFDRLIATWIPLSWALNMVNRSMGHADLYPFVVPPAALEKMRLVHDRILVCVQWQ
jgi:hypothetical protein